MSSYPDYPQTPPGGTPGASYGQGQGQDQARAQYGAPPAQEQYGVPAQQYGVQPYMQQQGYPAGMAQPQGQLVVAPKNPAVSLIASFFIPGLGSMINSRVGIGILILCIYVLGLILSLFLIGIPIAFGAWVWGLVDGYQSGQAWNRAHGIIS
jgi:TM2 domain-containing membrane protein YozV